MLSINAHIHSDLNPGLLALGLLRLVSCYRGVGALLLLAVLPALLACENLCHLAVGLHLLFLLCKFLQLLAKIAQFLACLARAFLLGLGLYNGAYSVLYLCISLAQQTLGLLACLLENLLAALLEFIALLLHLAKDFIEFFLLLVHILALALPVAFVAHNILQVLVALYIVASHNLRCVGNNLLGQANLACNLNGKR